MKKLSLLFLTFFIFSASYSQTARDYMQTGSDKGSAGDWIGAIADFTKAMELDPDFSYAYYMRGLAEAFLEDYDAAISDFTKFIEFDPNDPLGYSSRGNAKYLSEDNEEALADFNKAIELAADPGDYSSRGDVFRALANYDEAILDYNRAIDLLPEEDQKLGYIYYYMGYSKVMVGQMDGCIDLGKSILLGYEADLYCSVKNVEEYKAEGDLKITNGDYEGGIAEYTEAIALEPNDQFVYVARGSALYNIGDYVGAIADFTKSIELNEKPNTAMSYHRRALSKFQLADYVGAMEDLDQAIADDELNPEYYEARGILKIQLEQDESGCIDFKKALELGSTTAEQSIKDFCS